MNQPDGAVVAPIPIVDLAAQRRRIGPAIDAAIDRVLSHGQFILGPEVGDFERRLAEFCGVPHVLTTSSGTEALRLSEWLTDEAISLPMQA